MTQTIKLGYFADGPWGHEAFKRMVSDDKIEFKFIVPRNQTQDGTLKFFADDYRIDYITDVQVNSEEFYQKALKYDCDLFVSMSFNQIFGSRILNLPKHKTINCHAGKLPFYRGRNILNWALINDEKDFGITVHYVDEGIDTGDIILQRSYPITDDDNYGSLLERAYPACAEILHDAINKIRIDDVNPIKQSTIHPVGFYCGRRKKGDEIINWNRSSREIFNFIRAISVPGPGARTYLNDTEMIIYSANFLTLAPHYINKPGQILNKTNRGYLVKTADSFIEIVDFEYSNKIRIGDTFN